MILSETKVDSNGSVADYIEPFFDFGWKPLVNGQYRPVYNFSLGETVLFRAVCASVEPVYYLSITPYENTTDSSNVTLIPVAVDGFPVNFIREVLSHHECNCAVTHNFARFHAFKIRC